MEATKHRRKVRPTLRLDIGGLPIIITRHGSKLTVQYGTRVEKGLSYSEAAKCVGYSVLHALQCNGNLDGVS